MSFLGNISVFDHKSGEWSIFKGRLTQFFKINDVKVANKSAVLITHLSDETYRLLRNLVYPKDIDGLSYDDLVQVLDAHFKPKQCSFADKAKFYGATRNPGESLGEWAARLRGLASFCNFGTALESTLLDRFVLGLGMGPERDRLFEQDSSDLTFAKALEIAERAECAREAKALVTNGAGVVIQQEPVYRVASERGGAPRRPPPRAVPAAAAPGDQRDQHVSRCSVCGLKNHSELKCRFKSFKCQKCGVKGHLRKMCKLRVNNIETEENDSTCEDYAPWTWSDREEQAFQRIKRELASDRVLTHFDPEVRLTLCVDASPTGLGAYLAQGEEGHERPLAFASRTRMIHELHKGHLGVVKTKSLARTKMWWPGIDGDIQRSVLACSTCSALRPAPPAAPPAPWPRDPAPWTRLHIDYMQFAQRFYLIVVDSHSKWVECLYMSSVNPEMALETSGPPTAPPNLDNEPSVDEFHECDSEVVAGPSLESPATPAGAPVAVRGEDARPPHSQLTTAVTDNVTAESSKTNKGGVPCTVACA
ncbi:uncharacterized protein LOC125488966 [Plutella xylostella]|uniref:uncharacterized protein LOC125488966 n=1 Tax=Plutella xylostella TaxID=51655 RepID=UPI002033177D|nr:uncharacterized protein LOC125488966 [Plutella xylostella]